MNRTIQPAPVRRSVVVKAPPNRAFEVFTARLGDWWPKSHHIGKSEPQTFIIEPRAGGRWFERGVDGVECDVGHVLVWEPPHRLVLAWQLSAEWKYVRDFMTEVELRFTPEGERATRVDLEHRNLERYGELAEKVREAVGAPGGWTSILEEFARAAAR
ncbi:MAG TPA: SRPBCC family protein [Steroidobacteraceae bacterium]|nr:SRPBCC family protein [Steroidobacteraceae bacterium]